MEIIHAELIENYYGDHKIENWTTWFKELNIITKFEKAEFQIAKDTAYDKNDFEIQLKVSDYIGYSIKESDWIYIPETEFGGRIEKIDHSDDDLIKVSGPNFRYFLNKSVIWPRFNNELNAREDYLVIENIEANKALDELFNNVYFKCTAGIFRVSDIDTEIKVNAKARYEYLCDKAVSMLDEKGMRLKVSHSYETDTVQLKLEAIKKNKYDELYNSDFNIEINSKIDSTKAVDTILALGKGDVHERKLLLISYIKSEDRYIVSTPFHDGALGSADASMYVYDYPNCESDEDLADKAIEEFKKEHVKVEEITLNVIDAKVELNLGDIIGGTDEITGLHIETEITQKILTITNSETKYTYKVGD